MRMTLGYEDGTSMIQGESASGGVGHTRTSQSRQLNYLYECMQGGY